MNQSEERKDQWGRELKRRQLYTLLKEQHTSSLFTPRIPEVSEHATVTISKNDEFTAILMDNGSEIDSFQFTVKHIDGYLYTRRRWYVMSCIIVTMTDSIVIALGLDDQGYLHLIRHNYTIGGLALAFWANGWNETHAVFRRIEDQPNE